MQEPALAFWGLKGWMPFVSFVNVEVCRKVIAFWKVLLSTRMIGKEAIRF